ncbi:MAG: acyl carrier protein [Verrucomicrobiota bacterium]
MPDDPLLTLLLDFFDLPSETPPAEIKQESIAAWDSLAMVQLITELQRKFSIEFELEEIEALRSYAEIRTAVEKRGLLPTHPASR